MTPALRRWFDRTIHQLGLRTAVLCFVLVAMGAVTFVWNALGPNSARTWGVLIANWLFFAGLAMGAVAFRAALALAKAQWATSLLPLTRAVTSFVPPLAILLAVLTLGLREWATWTHGTAAAKSFWLNVPFFVARQLGGAGVLFWLAHRLTRRDQADDPGVETGASSALAVGFCLVYALVLSVWSFDFVLALDHEWVSTLIGPHLFMGAFLSGVAFVTVGAIATGVSTAAQRHDLGKLCFGLSVFWAYLLWSQYLPIWFGNLPEEIGFVLRRTEPPWGSLSMLTVGLTFIVPFVGLMHERAKRAPRVLATFAFCVLLGLWLERHLLVVPSLAGADAAPLSASDLFIAGGYLGVFGLSVGGAVLTPPSPAEVKRRVGKGRGN